MSDENDNVQDDGQQQQQQQQNDGGQQQDSFGNADLDKALDKWMNDDGTKSTVDKTQQPNGQSAGGTQQQGQQQRGQQQQQDRTQQQSAGGQQQQRGQSTGQDRTSQQVPAEARRYGTRFHQDARGNIYASATGELIAAAGRDHATFRRFMPHVQQLENEHAQMKQRIDAFESANQLAKAANLSLDEQGVGMQLMVSWKKDPLQTIRTLLTYAQQNGIDTSSIQQGGQQFDMSAFDTRMQALLDKAFSRFNPMAERFEQEAAERQATESMMHEYNAFMEEHPDAAHHQDVIARIMNDHNYSAREAFFALSAFVAQQGLDIKKPLGPQFQARGAGNGNGAPNGGNGNRLPDMNGGRGGGGGNRVVQHQPIALGGADESIDSIVDRTLRSYGINRQ